mmetsp:Transcript_5495/g.5916  ORF Transcript_5495/g.5916 Transcript_5495/m.5916 type:complete len:175 (-) Transcript_5495:269-793(-)|eukprot:CAMPEP_0176443700 /NCGR_PEP_ID=MMETSP0127-20121128/22595_1 /TAXON_ID=938130 /ORGANISM="Platyophrya macrostoma, Strain WH" /LENGTH=174 /DNA_ID=CAMNT_0017829011 /DNA_START=20 /DNA_END=544 /DNA_ORIENTATION=+
MSDDTQIQSQRPEEEVETGEYPSAEGLQQRKFPVTSRDKSAKKVFDSADYFMEQEKERKLAGATEEIPIPEYPHAKTPVLKFRRNQKKAFDSADYFMEQDKNREKTPAEANQPHEAASQKIEKIPAAEEQQQIDNSSTSNLPVGKRPVFKNGKTEKKLFDSADYFMNKQKQRRP